MPPSIFFPFCFLFFALYSTKGKTIFTTEYFSFSEVEVPPHRFFHGEAKSHEGVNALNHSLEAKKAKGHHTFESDSSLLIKVWPVPKEVHYYDDVVEKKNNIAILSVAEKVSVTADITEEINEDVQDSMYKDLESAFGRFFKNQEVKTLASGDVMQVERIIVRFMPSNSFNHSMEEYELFLSDGEVTVNIFSLLGLFHSLSTLEQLFSMPQAMPFPFRIFDYPSYPYRGLMVDVARHFLSIELLKRTVDAMAAAKLSILHLHLTDASSFPLLLDDTPLYNLSSLAVEGSFHSNGGKPKMYTKSDIKRLVNYAASWGIEVIPELDVPSHTLSWGKSFSQLVVNCSAFARYQETPQNVFALDPTNVDTLPLVFEVLKQIVEIFPSKFLHIGGDEVRLDCWIDVIREHDQSLLDILRGFMSDVFTLVKYLGKIPVVWQDLIDQHTFPSQQHEETVFTSSCFQAPLPELSFLTNHQFVLPSSDIMFSPSKSSAMSAVHSASWVVIETWKCRLGLEGNAASQALSNGFDVITSACWFLDMDSDFEQFLDADPLPAMEGAKSRLSSAGRVLGGEAAVWTERIDECNFECRTWPRAALMAQKLWAGGSVSAVTFHGVPALEVPKDVSIMALKLGYTRFRYFLTQEKFIDASQISIHRKFISSTSPFQYFPLGLTSENQLLSHWLESIRSSLTRRLDSMKTSTAVDELSSQCLGIPEQVQRPIASAIKTAIFLNIAEGAVGARRERLKKWLLAEADRGVRFVGLSELNGWQALDSTQDVTLNFPFIRRIAADCGFPYSHVMESSQPYNIGFMSAEKFDVIAEYFPPAFQRGLLHVYLPRLELHVIVCHLHAHSSLARELEAAKIASIVESLFQEDSRTNNVIVMGDFNSFYHNDSSLHGEWNHLFQSSSTPLINRLKRKFCLENSLAINYKPFEILVNSGLTDSCAQFCNRAQQYEQISYEKCYNKYCSYSSPTHHNPEWIGSKLYPTMPKIRLDFILFRFSNFSRRNIIAAGVIDDETTQDLSDHFPVQMSWID